MKKKYSRRGVGGRLLQSMEDYVISRERRSIYIDTSSAPAFGAARSFFYEKNSYRAECVLEDFYQKGGSKMIYMKEINH